MSRSELWQLCLDGIGFANTEASEESGKFLWRSTVENAKFDIFKKLPDGHPIWIKAVEGLDEAKSQLRQMAQSSPGDYFICNLRNGNVITQ